jgi:PAS domain S-box-containing protein
MEHMSDVISIFDREWRFLYLNAAGFEMAQFAEKKPEEVIGHSVWELRPDLVATPCYHNFRRAVEQQVPVQFEMYQPLNGRWFEHCCYPTLDGMATITREITEGKRAERRIRRQNAVMEGNNRILREALTCETEEELGQMCLRVAQEITSSELGLIGEIGPDGLLHVIAVSDSGWELCTMWDQTGHGTPPRKLTIHELYRRVLQDGMSLLTNAPAENLDSIGSPSKHPPITGFLGAPLVQSGKTIGVVAVANRDGGYQREELESLEALASAIVEALQRKRAEEALSQRVEELETIMDVVPAAVFVAHDPQCDTITGNKMVNQFYEASQGGNISANTSSLWRFFRDGRELRPEELPMQQAVRGQDVRDWELEVELPSSKRVATWGSASPLRDSQGNVRGCVGAFVDITERKRAEQELRKSEEQFRAMANAIPNIAWSTDAAGSVDYFNDWWYRYTGLTPEVSLGERGFVTAIHPDDAEVVLRARQNAIETGEIFELEHRIRRASDGSYRWHLSRCVPVRDAEGKVVRWVGTCTDIEELKQAQARVAERETWFHTLFDTIPLSVVLIDPHSRKPLQFSDTAAENLGYTREEFAKLTIDDIDAVNSPQQLDQHFKERLRSGGLAAFERKHRTKSGAIRDVVIYSNYLTMNGQTVANAVWHDVTEKKAAEAALLRSEKLASVGRMAATVAHEINNPLEMVTNCVYLAKTSRNLPPELKEHLEVAERELRRVAHIAKRTLGFYRENTKPAVVDIRTLVDEVVELYDPKFTRKDIRLKIEHNGHRAGTIAIAGEIRQVISNLLTNAIDASRPKDMVRVRTSRVTLNGSGYTRITVADAGAGISTANRSRVFEPFFTTKKAVGTGLGLWVSSEIIQKHKGQIRLRSVEGKGTVFSVFLPNPA